jgi:hypothetical protein
MCGGALGSCIFECFILTVGRWNPVYLAMFFAPRHSDIMTGIVDAAEVLSH